jgi:hypothetical protein
VFNVVDILGGKLCIFGDEVNRDCGWSLEDLQRMGTGRGLCEIVTSSVAWRHANSLSEQEHPRQHERTNSCFWAKEEVLQVTRTAAMAKTVENAFIVMLLLPVEADCEITQKNKWQQILERQRKIGY